MSKNYLLEIGVEELPARYVKDALRQLEEKFIKLLTEEKINFDSVKVYSTPRRLTAIISNLDEIQEDIHEEIKGPNKKIIFTDHGTPSKALEGFMKGNNVFIEDIFYKEIKGVEYVHVNVVKKGKDISTILAENISELIKSINFPKSMKWGGKNLKFARPIRWIVSLLDDEIVNFDFEGIKVSNITRGHRFLGKAEVEIDNVTNYMKLLKENYVIVDGEERKDLIRFGSEKLAREKGGKIPVDEKLLDEVNNLVEYPTPLIGRIKDEHLILPKDVVVTPMKEHLRYFPIVDDKDRLLPYFITVRNGNDQHLDIVSKGNEKVLGARLEDARFFYSDDISKPLESYIDRLKGIVFQDKLGTIYDKTLRVRNLADRIGNYLEVGEETQKNLSRAAYLSKADLVTKMVTEFTELQGKMGMDYAHKSGENEIVSLSIFEQYLPRYAGDKLPSTTAGAILSIADKLDSIAGLFAIGIQPTGSQDPFGLRRSAIGIINIILDRKLNISLNELIEFSLYIYVEDLSLVFDDNKVKYEIREFFNGRIKNMLSDMDIRYDIIDSVLSTGIDDFYDMKVRAEKINEWLKKEDMDQLLEGFNRVASLAQNTDRTEVSRDLLTEEEIGLYNDYNEVEDKFINCIEKKEYYSALEILSSLRDSINNYLDNVMVMVEDEDLKNNRLSLLRKIYEKMMMVSDFSKIVSK